MVTHQEMGLDLRYQVLTGDLGTDSRDYWGFGKQMCFRRLRRAKSSGDPAGTGSY